MKKIVLLLTIIGIFCIASCNKPNDVIDSNLTTSETTPTNSSVNESDSTNQSTKDDSNKTKPSTDEEDNKTSTSSDDEDEEWKGEIF